LTARIPRAILPPIERVRKGDGREIGKKEDVQEPRGTYATTSDEAVENTAVADMTATELEALIRRVLKEALQEVLEDTDVGLELRPEFEDRLRRATTYVASGGHLLSTKDLAEELSDPDGV
jgi:hypothetical protein